MPNERRSNGSKNGGLTKVYLLDERLTDEKNVNMQKTTSMPSGNFLLFLPTKGALTVFFRCLQKSCSFLYCHLCHHHWCHHLSNTRRYLFRWWSHQLLSSCSSLGLWGPELLPLTPCPTENIIAISMNIIMFDDDSINENNQKGKYVEDRSRWLGW